MTQTSYNSLVLGISLAVLSLLGSSCSRVTTEITSPNSLLMAKIFLLDNGQAAYQIIYKDDIIIDTSGLGFEFADAKVLSEGLEIVGSDSRFF